MRLFCVLSFCLLLVVIVFAEWVDYRIAISPRIRRSTDESEFNVECKKPGLTCGSDCVSVFLCIQNESGFYPYLAETCRDGTTCSDGKCSSTPSHVCSPGAKFPFVCKSTDGIYPDPADCRKYHYCVPNEVADLEHFEGKCRESYGFNPLTKHCDVPLKEEKCLSNPVPVCEEAAQTGTVSNNPSMYYVCLPYPDESNVLYPFLHTCPDDKKYTGKYSCGQVEDSTERDDPTTTTDD